MEDAIDKAAPHLPVADLDMNEEVIALECLLSDAATRDAALRVDDFVGSLRGRVGKNFSLQDLLRAAA